MKSRETFEAKVYEHAHQLLKTHETLLRDAVRNRAFYDALARHVTPESAVLDIGAGTGIWAVTAAKLGAKRTVAIDADEMLIGLIKRLAAEHDVADRVEAICGSSFDVELEREFDIIVSETIGYLGYDERIVDVMADARQRFLKPGGGLSPETVALDAAPAHLNVRRETVPVGLEFDLDGLRQLSLHSPRVLKRPRDAKLLARPKRLIQTDLYKAKATPLLENLHAAWDIENAEQADCFIVWVESRLAKGIRLSTRRTTSWLPNVYRIERAKGHWTGVALELSLTSKSNYWTATFTDGDKSSLQSYSPEFAARQMTPRLDIILRPAEGADEELLFAVYASTRRDEVTAFGWDEAQQEEFLRMQYNTQRAAYRVQSPHAEYSVITVNGMPAGRMIVDRSGANISLTDIAVLPGFRGKGIASHLIGELQNEATGTARGIVLHVDKVNVAARRLYEKMGFVAAAETELTIEMRWQCQ